MEMSVTQELANVYFEKKAVESYLKIGSYDSKALAEIQNFIFDVCEFNKKQPYHLLDIGVGPGGLTIPLLEYFISKGIDIYLDAFDASVEMIEKLNDRIRASAYESAIEKKMRVWINDAELELNAKPNARNQYDTVIITFVLYYLKDLPRFLQNLARILGPHALLIQAQEIGDFICLDNNFNALGKDTLFTKFWKTYFKKRERFNKWNPALSVSRFEPVLSSLAEMDSLNLLKTREFLWDVTLSYEEILPWLEYSPFAALGSGLDPENKRQLKNEMQQWLKQRGVNLARKFQISNGIKLFIHKKLGSLNHG